MATGVYGTGSDVLPEFTCAICLSDDRNTKAMFQCTDCQIFYCNKCVEGHDKFTIYKHNVVDDMSKLFGQSQKQATTKCPNELPTDVCDEHDGEVIDMFCKQHDQLCCVVCFAEKHGSCKDVKDIQYFAKGLTNGEEKGKAITCLEQVKDDLQNLKSRMQTELEELHDQRDGILDDIQKFTKHLIDRLLELEKKSSEEVKEKYRHIVDDFNTSRKKIDNEVDGVETRLRKLKCSVTKNDAQTFVDIKYGEKQVSDAYDCITQYNASKVKVLEFEINKSIKTSLYGVQTLGKLTVWTQEEGAGIRARQSNQFLQQERFGYMMSTPQAEKLPYMPMNQPRNRRSWPWPKDM